MLLPNSSVVPCPCPELSCGLSSSGAVWEEQENPRGSQSPAELWEGPCARLWIWGGRCLAGRGGDTGVSPPSLSLSLCPLLLVSCWADTPSPVPRSALWNTPPPNPVRVNPRIPQALPAGNGYPGPDCQFGPVGTHVQHWERIAAAVVAADTSPNVPLLGGCGRECRTIPGAALSRSLCLVPGYHLSPRCWHRPGNGDCSLCPLPLFIPVPCHLPLGLELFVPPPRSIPGTAELLDCWKLSRKETLFPLGLPGGTFTSGGCHGGHLPGTNTSRCVDYFS